MRRLLVALAISLVGALAFLSADPVRPESGPRLGFAACARHAAGASSTPQSSLGDSSPLPVEPEPVLRELRIAGDEDFLARTQEALDLIARRAPAYYPMVVHSIGVIEEVDRGSGAWAWQDPPRLTVGWETSHSLSGAMWYAGIIVHEAWHMKEYGEYRSSCPGQPVPAEAYVGEQAELASLAVQRAALRQLGAPQWMSDWTEEVEATAYWEIDDRPW